MILRPLCALVVIILPLWSEPRLPYTPPFYKIRSLLPASRRRKQGPSESLLKSHHYENS
jgi:hypothetical protein